VPRVLEEQQLVIGGRLIIPIGEHRWGQTLMKITRTAESKYHEEDLGSVRFVPLIDGEGCECSEPRSDRFW
jgi:protein-L-isoaspartate O-methyltransferase